MKKITITTAILLAGTVLANAQVDGAVTVPVSVPAVVSAPNIQLTQRQESEQRQPRKKMIKRPSSEQGIKSKISTLPPQGENKNGDIKGIEGQGPIPMTGDSFTDTKIKALIIEMETKIKAIRDDYQAQIKVVVGTRKIYNGTTTRPMMLKDQESDGQRLGSSARPFDQNEDQNNGDDQGDNPQNVGTSSDNNISPMPRRDSGEVKGISTKNVGQAVGDGVILRFRNFFRGMMGGN